MASDPKKELVTQLTSKIPRLTRRQSVGLVAVVIVITPVAYIVNNWLTRDTPSKPDVSSRVEQSQAVSGDNNNVMGDIGSVTGNVILNVPPSSPLPEDTDDVVFTPIVDLSEKLDSLTFTGASPFLKLRFKCQQWPIDRVLEIPQTTPISDLLETLLERTEIPLHVRVDLTKFPPIKGGAWRSEWGLYLNGKSIEPYKNTLLSVNAKDGDVLQLRLTWQLIFLTTLSESKPTSDPPKMRQPPNIDL